MSSSAQNSKQFLAQPGTATVPSYSFLGGGSTGLYRSATNEISVATAGTQRVVVDASGNVGIGTSSPGSKLDVNGNIAATTFSGAWQGTAVGILYGGTGLTTTPANGALDIGNGTGFTRTTLTAGTNITITNGAGSISIAATGGGVTSLAAGNGITVSGSTGAVTVSVVTTLGAVGTYAYLASATNESFTAGTTYAGSNLRYSGFQSNNYTVTGLCPGGFAVTGGPAAPLGGTPSGTWQAMGTVAAGSASPTATLFIRTV
jgi:hypothetical protein